MVVEALGAFDFWTLFVEYTFGGFWLAVAGLTLLIYVMMGFLGRISIVSCTWYCAMFLLAMTLGYGYTFLNIAISLGFIVAFIFAIRGYIERGGQ